MPTSVLSMRTVDGKMSENNIAHRRIATQKITISAIRVLDHDQLNRLQDVPEPHRSGQGISHAGTRV